MIRLISVHSQEIMPNSSPKNNSQQKIESVNNSNTNIIAKRKIQVFSSQQNPNKTRKCPVGQKKSKMSAFSQLNRHSENNIQNQNKNKKSWLKIIDCMLEPQNQIIKSQTKSQIIFQTKSNRNSIKSTTPMVKLQQDDLWSQKFQELNHKKIHKLKSWQSNLLNSQKQQVYYVSPYINSQSQIGQSIHFDMSKKKREIYTTNTSKIDQLLDESQVKQF